MKHISSILQAHQRLRHLCVIGGHREAAQRGCSDAALEARMPRSSTLVAQEAIQLLVVDVPAPR